MQDFKSLAISDPGPHLFFHIVPVLSGVDIVSLFPADGRGGCGAVVVPRPDDGLVGEAHQSADGCPQRGAMAAGQVGAAAVPDKEGVTGEEIALGMKADAAGGVARGVHNVKSNGTQL